MLPIIENVEIEQAVIIQCPLVDFKPRRACVACPKCENFEGISLMCEADKPWNEKYVIRCRGVIERRTHMIPDVIEE